MDAEKSKTFFNERTGEVWGRTFTPRADLPSVPLAARDVLDCLEERGRPYIHAATAAAWQLEMHVWADKESNLQLTPVPLPHSQMFLKLNSVTNLQNFCSRAHQKSLKTGI